MEIEDQIEKENNHTILKHTAMFSIFVLLAQVFGLVRDLYLTRVFGVGQILDTYYMAFKVPDFLNIFYSVFLGSVIFIPLLTKAKNKDGQKDNRVEMISQINTISSMVIVLLVSFSTLLFIFMPYLTNLISPAWPTEQKELLTSLSRLLLFGQFFFPIGILAGCVGMVYKKPFGMAISGLVYNLSILIFSLVLVPFFEIYGLVYSVILGAISFMLIQIYPMEVRDILRHFKFKISFLEWRKFVLHNIGRFFAVIAFQIYGVVILVLAGLSGPGGVSSFSIAYNIYLAAFFVLGASFSTVLMPRISELHTRGEKIKQRENLRFSIFAIFVVSAFSAICLFFLSEIIIKLLYYFSKLTPEQEVYIASLLAMLSFSFPFFNILEVVRKYLYSTSQIFLAGSITIFMLIAVSAFTFIFNLFLTKGILFSLILSMNLSLFLATIFILIILKAKQEI